MKAVNNIIIGIASTVHHCDSYFYRDQDPNNYAYYNDGRKTSAQVNYTAYPSQDNKVMYSEGDTITVHLDLEAGTIGFSKNGLYLGMAFENVNKLQTYRLAICLHKGSGKLEMVSYDGDNYTEENKENNIVDNTEQAQMVKAWLKDKVKLPQYTDIFLQNGFDDMMVIKELTIDDLKEMDTKNKIKLGHKKKILIFVRELNH